MSDLFDFFPESVKEMLIAQHLNYKHTLISGYCTCRLYPIITSNVKAFDIQPLVYMYVYIHVLRVYVHVHVFYIVRFGKNHTCI